MELSVILESVFPILLDVEGNPSMDILSRTIVNQISQDPYTKVPPYTVIMENVPCVFSASMIKSTQDDPLEKVNLSFYCLRKDLSSLHLSEKYILKYKGDIYSIPPGCVFENFGVIQIAVMKGN